MIIFLFLVDLKCPFFVVQETWNYRKHETLFSFKRIYIDGSKCGIGDSAIKQNPSLLLKNLLYHVQGGKGKRFLVLSHLVPDKITKNTWADILFPVYHQIKCRVMKQWHQTVQSVIILALELRVYICVVLMSLYKQ